MLFENLHCSPFSKYDEFQSLCQSRFSIYNNWREAALCKKIVGSVTAARETTSVHKPKDKGQSVAVA